MKWLVAALYLFAGPAFGQASATALESCRAYAKKDLARGELRAKDVLIEQDASLSSERYAKKLGSQHINTVLTGHGAVVFDNAPSAELAFVCLLADDKRAVFFQWMPRQNVAALNQCRRAIQARPCLELLLDMAEAELTQSYALRFQEARERDSAGKEERSVLAYRKSNEEWLQYRDAECARRRELAPQGVSPEDYELACRVDLTRRRGLDMGTPR